MRSVLLPCLLFSAAPMVAVPARAAVDPASIPAGRYVMDHDHKKLSWGVDHMGFSIYYGRLTRFDGSMTIDPTKPGASSVAVTIDMTSIATDNDKLDSELKGANWFDAGKFPTASFVSTSVLPSGPDHARVTGNLTLHGVTRPVTLDVTLHGAGIHPLMKVETVGFDATATFKRSDFGVSTFAPMIADTILLTISTEFHLAG